MIGGFGYVLVFGFVVYMLKIVVVKDIWVCLMECVYVEVIMVLVLVLLVKIGVGIWVVSFLCVLFDLFWMGCYGECVENMVWLLIVICECYYVFWY